MHDALMRWQWNLVLVVSGLALVAAGVPLMRRRVPPNPWYGIRIPSTLADERTWYEVNARSGRDLLIVGATVAALAAIVPLILSRWRPEWRTLLVALVLIAGLATATGRALRHARQLRDE